MTCTLRQRVSNIGSDSVGPDAPTGDRKQTSHLWGSCVLFSRNVFNSKRDLAHSCSGEVLSHNTFLFGKFALGKIRQHYVNDDRLFPTTLL